MDPLANLRSNIWKYYTAGVLQSFWFALSINILYWQSFDMSFTQIGLFEMIGALTIIILEAPTGAFADLISRKYSVFIGVVLVAMACFIVGLSSTFSIFAFAYLVWAIGDTFISGAESALIFDTLKDLDKEKEYLKIKSKYHLLTTISLLFATAIGPYLFSINRRLPYLALGVCWALSSIFILMMKEPSREKVRYTISKHLSQMKEGFKYSFHHKLIRWYFAFSILIGLPMLVYNSLVSQSYYINIGYAIPDLAFLIPLIYGLASLIASQSHKIEAKLGEKTSLVLIALCHALCFLVMGLLKTPFVIMAVIILYISRDFRWAVMDQYVNQHVTSKLRATVISVGSMLTNLVMIFAYPTAGKIIDTFGMFQSILWFGIFLALASAYLFWTKPGLVLTSPNQKQEV